MAYKILSIDGGGARGIIPLTILAELEDQTGIHTADRFNLLAGTSTGGLIACALTLKESASSTKSKYSASDLLKIYKEHVPKIFKPRYINRYISHKMSYFWPQYDSTKLHDSFKEILGDAKLLDCRKPIFISSYDIRNRKPVYFSSRYVTPGTSDYHNNNNILLTDICSATSAAPTYFAPFKFDLYYSEDLPTQLHCIDGGVFVNNPSLAAYIDVKKNLHCQVYHSARDQPVKILSLGTGSIGSKLRADKNMNNVGKLRWAKPLIELLMEANSQVVNHQMKTLVSDGDYLRIEPLLNEFPDMDECTTEALASWTQGAYSRIINDRLQWGLIKDF